jgi:mannose-6-phosphate isomerase-like protein (cupin superfamily)
MKTIVSVLVFLLAVFTAEPRLAVAQQPAASSGEATDVTAAEIQARLQRSPQAAVNPQPNLRVVDAGGYNVAVGAIHRPQSPPGVAAVHFKVTEVYHVTDGAGTLVTGGTMVNAKTRPPDSLAVTQEDGPGASGTSIQGGKSRRIKTGDVVVIPAGVPHWFSNIEGSISYVVVRVDPSRVLALK